VCPVTVAGRDLLASAGDDQTVRIWDPATGGCLLTIPVHHVAVTAAQVAGQLVIGLDAGLLVIKLSSPL
jgi:WD40 repeat protein